MRYQLIITVFTHLCLGVIHKPINHVDRILDFFDPPPPLWTILLNRAYVVIWTFGKPPSPCLVHMVYE